MEKRTKKKQRKPEWENGMEVVGGMGVVQGKPEQGRIGVGNVGVGVGFEEGMMVVIENGPGVTRLKKWLMNVGGETVQGIRGMREK